MKWLDKIPLAPLLVIALGRLSDAVGLLQVAMFGLTLLSGGLIVYSVWLILATFSFWFVKVECS
jgi:ABC-type uncharacterized transport system permease subunit